MLLAMKKQYSDGEFQQLVVAQFKSVHSELKEVKSDIKEIKSEIIDMKDVLYPLAKAFDVDSQTLVEHDRRLSRVEGHLGLGKS